MATTAEVSTNIRVDIDGDLFQPLTERAALGGASQFALERGNDSFGHGLPALCGKLARKFGGPRVTNVQGHLRIPVLADVYILC